MNLEFELTIMWYTDIYSTLCQLKTIFLTDGTHVITFLKSWILSRTYNCSVSWQPASRLAHWEQLQMKKNSLSMFVLLGWLTVSASAGLRGHFYLVKLKRIWIIDGENDTSVAWGNERPTPSSLLSLLWLTKSANKDDTWQLTRPISGGDMHTYTEEDRQKENGRERKIERKQNIRGEQVSSGHLTSDWPNNLVSSQGPSGELH